MQIAADIPRHAPKRPQYTLTHPAFGTPLKERIVLKRILQEARERSPL